MTQDSFAPVSGLPRGWGRGSGPDRVVRVADCRLVVDDATWPFASSAATSIDGHWQQRHAQQPQMFNGAIHLLHTESLDETTGGFSGTFLRTDFKSYLTWRETGFPETGVRDAFGSALIRSAEGHVILGRQRAGNVNAGLAYLPGGFIDPKDIRTDGTIDIEGSIVRELAEETGLTAADVHVVPGYLMTWCGALIAMSREVVTTLPADALRARMLGHIAADPDSELVDAVIIRSASEMEGEAMHPYARQLLSWVFGVER